MMYEKVTEYNGRSENDNDGKTVYHYSVPTYRWNVADIHERLNHKYGDWQYGHLTCKTVYKRNANIYIPLLKEEYMYTSNCNVGYAWVGEYEINTIINLPSEGEHSSYPHEWDNNFFSGARQSYPFFSHVPREKRITVYDNNGHSQVTTDSFSYSIPYCTLMTEKRIRRNNTMYSESYEYPYDHRSSSPYNAMVEKNILSPVIKSTYNRDGKTFVTMTPFNSMYKPAAIKTSYNGSSLMERVNYLYDDNGNKIQASKDGRENAVFLYGYNNQYPVAVIENTTWAAVLSTLGSNFVQSLRQSSQPSAYQWSRFNQLRTTNKDWHITTYKYKPLVGVTSVIDPSGKETRFCYDALGRLIKKSIYTNGTEKVLEKYEYNHKTNQHE